MGRLAHAGRGSGAARAPGRLPARPAPCTVMPLSTTLYAGTDVSQAANRTRFFDDQGGEIGRRFESANDLPGSKALVVGAMRCADTIGAQEIRWALEAT